MPGRAPIFNIPEELFQDMFKFQDEDKSISTHILAKVSVSNPNFVTLQVKSLTISLDYICKSCADADKKSLGQRSVDVNATFPPRTQSATLPWTLDFFSTMPRDEFTKLKDGLHQNCTRDRIYFVHPTCSATITYLGVKRTVKFDALRTRVPCESVLLPPHI
uniref:Uncharacterized protein n=1 Tax=Spongospora subterranea TaxID=70186 RepID=A0A0H5QKV5_9EUKA|eukprot:CRZ01961.1 hypothetical protein [Spongospora subterranea]